MKNIGLFLLILLLTGCACGKLTVISTQNKTGEKTTFFLPEDWASDRLWNLYFSKEHEEFIAFANGFLEKDNNPFIRQQLASVYTELGEIYKSINLYEEALRNTQTDRNLEAVIYFKLWGLYTFDKVDINKANENLQWFSSSLQSLSQEELNAIEEFLYTDLSSSGRYFLNTLHEPSKALKYYERLIKLKEYMGSSPKIKNVNGYKKIELNIVISKHNMSIADKNKDAYLASMVELEKIIQNSQEEEIVNFAKEVFEGSKEKNKNIFDNKK